MGKEYVVMGAQLECSLGLTPSVLMVPVPKGLTVKNKPVATQMDMAPMVNILPFGTCKMSYPPRPCIPAPCGPWMKPNTKFKATQMPVLTTDSCLMCAFGGKISIKSSGQ